MQRTTLGPAVLFLFFILCLAVPCQAGESAPGSKFTLPAAGDADQKATSAAKTKPGATADRDAARAAAGIRDSFTDEELMQILRNMGYGSVKLVDKQAILFSSDGVSYVLFNQKDGDLQGYYSIGGARLDYEDVNEWNRTKRLSCAYLDKDKDPVLEADLLSDGGITVANVEKFVKVFTQSALLFKLFVIEHNKS